MLRGEVIFMHRKKWIALVIVLLVFLAGITVEGVAGTYAALRDHPAISWEENVVSGSGNNKIVQLFVSGVISGTQNATGAPSMTEVISEQLRRVEEDASVKVYFFVSVIQFQKVIKLSLIWFFDAGQRVGALYGQGTHHL